MGDPWENDGWKLTGSYRISYNHHNSTSTTNSEAQRLNIIIMGDLA